MIIYLRLIDFDFTQLIRASACSFVLIFRGFLSLSVLIKFVLIKKECIWKVCMAKYLQVRKISRTADFEKIRGNLISRTANLEKFRGNLISRTANLEKFRGNLISRI